jgi:uncharacterized protein
VQFLVERGANLKLTTTEGATPLHIAAEGGHNDIVSFLLDNKADINSTTNEGNTPLMSAAGRNRPETVKLLIARGADTKIQNKNHKTAADLSPNSEVTLALVRE